MSGHLCRVTVSYLNIECFPLSYLNNLHVCVYSCVSPPSSPNRKVTNGNGSVSPVLINGDEGVGPKLTNGHSKEVGSLDPLYVHICTCS